MLISRSTYEELLRSAAESSLQTVVPDMSDHTHQKQFDATEDSALFVALLCSRRAGKSTGIALKWLQGAYDWAGTASVYITRTAALSKQILWDRILSRMVERRGLPVKLANRHGELMVEHENGSTLWLAGCPTLPSVEKFVGQPFLYAFVDEAESFNDQVLRKLIDHALTPALADMHGQLYVAGMPGVSAVGHFHDITQGLEEGWSVHSWTLFDNPYMRDPRGFVQEIIDRRKLSWDHPTIVRAYGGKWCNDTGSLVYPFSRAVNSWTPGTTPAGVIMATETPYGLPPGEYSFGLGVDLGWGEGALAFVLVAVEKGAGRAYVLSASTRERMTPLAIAAHVKAVRERVMQLTGCWLTVVVDEGALGAGYAQQLRDLGVSCEPAEKQFKVTYQEYVRGLIKAGSLLVHYSDCSELVYEAAKLSVDPETGKEDERYPNHCCDGMLYIVRKLLPAYDPKEDEPAPGSPEAIRRELAKDKKRLADELTKQQRRTRLSHDELGPEEEGRPWARGAKHHLDPEEAEFWETRARAA